MVMPIDNIKKFIHKHTLNKVIDISDIPLTNQNILTISNAIKDHNINRLCSHYNIIDEKQMKDISLYLLTGNSDLKSISMIYNNLTDNSITYLFTALKTCCNLRILSYSGKDLYLHNYSSIPKFVKNCLLTYLSLTIHANNNIMKLIAAALEHNITIITFNMSYCYTISSISAKYISNILNTTNIKHLYLCENKIGCDGIKYIATALKHNHKLERLSIKSNNINNKGAKYISNCLKHNSTIIYLDISQNKFGDKGLKHIANCLISNKILQDLNISWNSNITTIGIKYLAKALMHQQIYKNYSLHSLNLGFLNLFNKGVNYICNALKYHTSMYYLNLNIKKMDTHKHIAKLLKYNQSINELDCGFDIDLKNNTVQKVLYNNPSIIKTNNYENDTYFATIFNRNKHNITQKYITLTNLVCNNLPRY